MKTAPGFERITFDPKVMAGKACIRGMPITATLVLDLLANGMPAKEIIRHYPPLELEDVYQVLRYAASLVERQVEPAELE